jgi:hypothetical protein
MLSLKRTLAITGAFIALAALAPVTSAGTDKGFHLDKTCAEDLSEPLGFVCTIQHSDFKWIPAGTDIHYSAIGDLDPNVVVAATITIRNGSTTGVCVFSTVVNAICTFESGTGRLAQFNLEVVVTASADQAIWYWDGAYSFGN